MKLYFYPASRAHHAYCMALDFGMKFKTTKDSLWEPEGLLHIRGASGYKIMVAEESMHLLESNDETDLTVNGLTRAVDANPVSKEANRILQRNGIPFHWPEILREPASADGNSTADSPINKE